MRGNIKLPDVSIGKNSSHGKILAQPGFQVYGTSFRKALFNGTVTLVDHVEKCVQVGDVLQL